MLLECEKLLGGVTAGMAVERILEDRLKEVNSRFRLGGGLPHQHDHLTLSQVM